MLVVAQDVHQPIQAELDVGVFEIPQGLRSIAGISRSGQRLHGLQQIPHRWR